MRETKRVVPEKFFDQVGAVLDSVPLIPGDETHDGQLRGRPYSAPIDPAIHRSRATEQYFPYHQR